MSTGLVSKPGDISAAAAHCAHVLLKNFNFTEREGGRMKATEKNIALLIDVCTQIFRVEIVMNQFAQAIPRLDKDSLKENLDMLAKAVRAIDLVRRTLPSYGSGAVHRGSQQAPELNRPTEAHLAKVSNELRKARTPGEEQQLLRDIGLAR